MHKRLRHLSFCVMNCLNNMVLLRIQYMIIASSLSINIVLTLLFWIKTQHLFKLFTLMLAVHLLWSHFLVIVGSWLSTSRSNFAYYLHSKNEVFSCSCLFIKWLPLTLQKFAHFGVIKDEYIDWWFQTYLDDHGMNHLSKNLWKNSSRKWICWK